MLVDFYIVRRGQARHAGAVRRPATSRYGDVNWAAIDRRGRRPHRRLGVGVRARQFFQGPIAKATNNTDLSWLAAIVVSGGLYYVLRPMLAKDTSVATTRRVD